jgi:uncharacterized delta-60 repeat protein
MLDVTRLPRPTHPSIPGTHHEHLPPSRPFGRDRGDRGRHARRGFAGVGGDQPGELPARRRHRHRRPLRSDRDGGGSGEAVALEPDGGIVTVGRRGDGARFDFAATRHDTAGRLDSGFGTAGIATTDLGGGDDEAFDAAPFADDGFVAVGRTDAKGLANIDFGVVRYTASGAVDAGFGSGGTVKTDISGRGDQANAVAVQPDGRIVVAGLATDNVIDGDFALARYNPDGTLDTTFGGDGIVPTDLGTHDDAALALALQPDGRIVAAGATVDGTDLEFALMRANP